MIDSIEFKNFKVLRDTTLPLRQFTLIVGPNGSGKSTALQALGLIAHPDNISPSMVTIGLDRGNAPEIEFRVYLTSHHVNAISVTRWSSRQGARIEHNLVRGTVEDAEQLNSLLQRSRVFGLDATAIARPVPLTPYMELESNAANLAGVLDRLRDHYPDRFDALSDELQRWLPEFDRVLFDTPDQGHRAIALRTRDGGHKIPAKDLSQGTLLALAILTLAYLPEPPPVVGFEEPDRGIHPRLLRDVRDALYRLAYPQDFGEKREPVQVIATTHSPYFMDLFSDHPEEIVIAEKVDAEARFVKLTSLPNVDEILRDSHLGEAWYSGILGGVPAQP